MQTAWPPSPRLSGCSRLVDSLRPRIGKEEMCLRGESMTHVGFQSRAFEQRIIGSLSPASAHLHLQERCIHVQSRAPSQGPQRANRPQENQTLNAGEGGWASSTASPPQAPDCSSLYLPLEMSKGTYLSLPTAQGLPALPPRTGLLRI